MLDFLIYPAVIILRSNPGKLVFLLLGMILVLGPSNLTSEKIFYFIVVTIMFFLVLTKRNILPISSIDTPKTFYGYLGKIRILQQLQFLIIFSTSIGALINGLPVFQLLRGSVTAYIVFLGIPIAVYVGFFSSRVILLNIFMTIGIFAAASTAVYWGQRHNFWSLGFDRLAYDATFCAYFALCISLKFKFSNSFSKFLAKFTNVSIPILLLISLNRTDFVFLIWLYAFFVIKSRVNLSIVLKTLVATMILLIIGLTDLTWAFFNQFPQFKSRYSDSFIQLLPQIFAYDTAINDQSLIVRRLHGEMALEAFRTNALFGKGVLPTNTYYDHFYGSFAVLGLIGFSLVVYFIFRLKKDVTTGQFDKDLAQAIFLFLSLLIPASFIINWTSSKSLWIVCLSIIALNASNNGFELKRYIEMSDRNIDS